MTTRVDLPAIDQIIREVAAAEIMPRFRKLAAGDIEMKGINDPVTIADKETEIRLTERLTDYLPGSVVVGEETYAKDHDIMVHLGRDLPVWVIDPIDGTRNFVSGKPEFAVMVGLVQDRRTIASWIHDPNSGDTIMAEQGAGVWLRDKKLRLVGNDPSAIGLVGARVKKLISDPAVMPEGQTTPNVEIGSCAGFDYPRLFMGEVMFANASSRRASFAIYRHSNAWDHVPGLFMHHEAGGYSADWFRQPYDMDKPHQGLLLAEDQKTWETLYVTFKPLIQHVLQKPV